MLTGFRLIRARSGESSFEHHRALVINPGAVYLDDERYARNFEVPSGGGVATARGIAHAYGVFAAGGRKLGCGGTLDLWRPPRFHRRAVL
jgi:hypothetical protein